MMASVGTPPSPDYGKEFEGHARMSEKTDAAHFLATPRHSGVRPE